MSERNSRESKNRDNSERVTEWKPPSTLEAPEPPAEELTKYIWAPEPPVGYKHRWIRESVMEYDDRNNIHKKRREGYELVKAEEYPDFDAPVIDEGKNSGVIGVGGLVLARIPEEIAEQRNKHYSNVAKNQMEAVDRDWMRENNPNMPKLAPQRSTSVTFGSQKPNTE